MLAILSAPGSRGDVNPMVAIGRELRSRGIDVVISVAEPYAALARQAGLQVNVVISDQQFQETLAVAEVWKTIRGVRVVLRTIVEQFLDNHFQLIQRLHRQRETILVAHPLDLSSRVFRDIHPSIPLATIHLSPVILRTLDAPPRLTPWPAEVQRPAWALRSAYWLADRLGIDPMIAPPVNRLRAEYSLPPLKRLLDQWWHSPDRVIAMYPKWYAPAAQAACPQLVYAGFPLDDLQDTNTDSWSQQRPLVFTAGTANHHCRRFFCQAVDACVKLNHPGLLLSTCKDNFPDKLPDLVTASDYVSLRSLLPSCAAIVHHGGIGTTSQALAAGTPQVICPMAFDQFDNATRVASFGCGLWLRRKRGLADALATCLQGEFDSACRETARRFQAESAAKIAAAEVHRMLGCDA